LPPAHEAEFGTWARAQETVGNGAVAGLVSALHLQREAAAAHESSADELRATAEKVMVDAVALFGVVNENEATDQVFWLEHPDLRGEKLKAGTSEAQEWLRLRDAVVHPTLRELRAQLAATARASASTKAEPPAQA
jgi:hypothetical protein